MSRHKRSTLSTYWRSLAELPISWGSGVTTPKEAEDVWLADLPPTARQNWAALAMAALVLVAFAAVVPFTGRPLARVNALFPALDAIVFVTELITSVLLFAQFSISRSRALLALANGYLFTALIVIPHALTFAGAFSPTGLLGAGLQTGSWLFLFAHLGFAIGLLGYAMLRRSKRSKRMSEPSVLPAIYLSVAGAVGLVCGLTLLATAGEDLLPPIILDKARISPSVIYPVWLAILITTAAIAILSFRRRSVLDQWLMIVALVSIADLAFSGLLPSVRFSVGFYAGRVFSIITSSIVLIVLLAETMRLDAKLAHSNAMLRREQDNKLMNLEAMTASISHELRQPLGAIVANTEAAKLYAEREPPDLGKALSILDNVIRDTHRASDTLESVGNLFRKRRGVHEPVDLNDVAKGALRLLRGETERHGVTTGAELASEPPLVIGHRGQLQEVITNLLQNAIEAMDSVKGHPRVLTIRTGRDGDKGVAVEVQDTGPGIDPENIDKIFDVFVTTKPTGMGLGLAICRLIVSSHGGELSASPARRRGTIFRVVLPRAHVPQ